MVLNKFLKPLLASFTKEKWQSKNPDIRKKAVQDLPVSKQDILADIAMNDTDESIRAIAAHKISDLDLLQTIIMKGTNGTVKEAAQTRMFQLLSGLKHPVPEFNVREKMIRGSRNPALLEFVAANADQSSLRELCIPKISRDPLLGDIALTDENSKIRQLAAQHIAKRSTLERVAKQSRRKDKRVYKIVKSKLDRIIEDEERPLLLAREVVDICDKLEKLNKRNRLLQEKTTFENYVARWSEIQNFANEEITERYHTICAEIISRIDDLEAARRAEQEAIAKLDTILSSLSSSVDDLLDIRSTDSPDEKLIEEKEKVISNLGIDWDETIKQINDNELIATYNKKFQASLDLIDNLDHTKKHSDNNDQLQSVVEQMEDITEKSTYLMAKTLSVLQDKFNHLISNHNSSEARALAERFHKAYSLVQDKLAIQQEKTKHFKNDTEQQINTIKNLIDDGLVSKADKQLHELFKKIDGSKVLSSTEKQNYHQQLRDIQSELGNLSSWRNWAHDNERANLVYKAEQLVQHTEDNTDLENEFADVITEIRALRKQWKSLRSQTQEEMWERFNNACNSAYSLCKPYIEEQTQQRQASLKAKESLCEQLETYIATMGWPTADNAPIDTTIDWIKVDKITRQARKEWSQTGFVERKKHKAISRRFDKAIETIRHELKKVWYANQEKFTALIEKVQALEENLDNDLNGAINKAKQYQQEWKTIGPVSPYQRNKLWKKFRSACDLVFNKRQQNIEQKNSQNSERLHEKEAICENLEALNQQPLGYKDLQNAFNDIDVLWQELMPQAKAISKEVNARYSKAKKVFQEKITQQLEQEQQQEIDRLKQKAKLCTQLEALESDEPAQIDIINQQWRELASLTPSLENKIQRRFDQALKNITQDKTSLKETEQQEKQQFCLKYEILTGKNSPEDQQNARMQMQVELLNSNLGQHNPDTKSHDYSPCQLQQQWYVMSNYSQNKDLQARFEKLLS